MNLEAQIAMYKACMAFDWPNRQFPQKPLQKLILCAMYQHYNPTLKVVQDVSINYLAAFCCSAKSTIRKELAALVGDDKYLIRVQLPGSASSFQLNLDKNDAAERHAKLTALHMSGVSKTTSVSVDNSTPPDMSAPTPPDLGVPPPDMSAPTPPQSGAPLLDPGVPPPDMSAPYISSSNSISSKENEDGVNYASPMTLDWKPSKHFFTRLEIYKLPAIKEFYLANAEMLLLKFQDWWMSNKATYRKNQSGWDLQFLEHVENRFNRSQEKNTKPVNQSRGSRHGQQESAANKFQSDQQEFERELAELSSESGLGETFEHGECFG